MYTRSGSRSIWLGFSPAARRLSLRGPLDIRDDVHLVRDVYALQLVVLDDALGPVDSPLLVLVGAVLDHGVAVDDRVHDPVSGVVLNGANRNGHQRSSPTGRNRMPSSVISGT